MTDDTPRHFRGTRPGIIQPASGFRGRAGMRLGTDEHGRRTARPAEPDGAEADRAEAESGGEGLVISLADPDTVEADRVEMLAALRQAWRAGGNTTSVEEHFAPGASPFFETKAAATIALDLVYRRLVDSPPALLDGELFLLAHRAFELLHAVEQILAGAHVAATGEPPAAGDVN